MNIKKMTVFRVIYLAGAKIHKFHIRLQRLRSGLGFLFVAVQVRHWIDSIWRELEGADISPVSRTGDWPTS